MTTALTPITLRRMADPPYGGELSAFCSMLIRQRYASLVIDAHIRRISRALPRLRGSHHTREAVHRAFLLPAKTLRKHRYLTASATVYCRYLHAEGRLKPTPDQGRYSGLRSAYAQFLVEMRGLSRSTREHHAAVVRDFLNRALEPGQSLRSLAAAQVERFVTLRGREISRHSLQHDVAYVRAFLRYCHDHGHVPRRLDAVETVRTYRGELPPKALPWSDVERLLAAVDRQHRCGVRDYTMLHLMAYYGLRPSEVIGLRVASIDWDRALLHVEQCKTGSRLVLPLAEPTARILRDYLAGERALAGDEHPELFLRATNPPGPMTHYALNDVFEKYACAAGLEDTGGHVYRLRHSFAMRLLTSGVGVKAIGDVLGHRSIETTCTYLRLDADALRSVALEVPDGAASQEVSHA